MKAEKTEKTTDEEEEELNSANSEKATEEEEAEERGGGGGGGGGEGGGKSADPPVERVDPSSFPLFLLSSFPGIQISKPPNPRGEVYLPPPPSWLPARRLPFALGLHFTCSENR